MTATYNEIDSYAADWISNLASAGHVAPGRVDTRSITELTAEDVRHVAQAHFFAGIAVWSAAARAAGWPDDAPLWTGSCPCQPFSQAGRGKGTKDERHLWPEWFRLIRECMPPVIVGEQVASPAGLGWLDAVFADLESEGYACGAAVLGAHSVGAPHKRSRLYWLGYSAGERLGRGGADGGGFQPEVPGSGFEPLELGDSQGRGCLRERDHGEAAGEFMAAADAGSAADGLAVARSERQIRGARQGYAERRIHGRTAGCGAEDALADAERGRLAPPLPEHLEDSEDRTGPRPAACDSFWSDCEWLPCRDGKARPIEPGTFPLAYGVPARVVKLRGYGNAIVPQVAAAFIEAVLKY